MKNLCMYMVGAGQVGGTLLDEIHQTEQFLLQNHGLTIKLIALANSKKMLFEKNGIQFMNWREQLAEASEGTNMGGFVCQMKEWNCGACVFVDCTASDEVVGWYETILSAPISIVTPNKKANVGSMAQYNTLKIAAAHHGVQFLYETNVGAGLPIISTLHDLIASGDRIIAIEAILSGTLSYIFNTFVGTVRFSDTLKDAKRLGYTEPNPRDDLSGTDVARKLLILAREAGYAMNFEDICVEDLMPASFGSFEDSDEHFEQKKLAAEKRGEVLRYIATLKNGKGEIVLRSVAKDHPFYDMQGNNNVVAFTTHRYKDHPLVIQGPGAGATVTAAGVLADIIRVAKCL